MRDGEFARMEHYLWAPCFPGDDGELRPEFRDLNMEPTLDAPDYLPYGGAFRVEGGRGGNGHLIDSDRYGWRQ